MGQFGQFFKQKRLALGYTLRNFCVNNKLDAGNISKLERGKLAPPQGDKLKEYACYLDLKEGTDDWYTFFDLAAAEKGKIPDDLMSDEQLVQKLPIFYRTLRGEQVSEETLHKIIDITRRA